MQSARLRGLAAVLVLVLVAWQAAASADDVRSELLGRPLAQHLALFRATPEELVERALGTDHALWRALRAHVPAERTVLVSYPAGLGVAELKRRLTRLVTLSYPLHFQGWPHDPRRPRGDGPWTTGLEEYVIDLDSGRAFSGWARCDELARGPGFRLLVLRSEPR